jgi:hypothetical protein
METVFNVLFRVRVVGLQGQSAFPFLNRFLDFFFNEKIKLINFKQEEPTLEDAFIELTGAGVGH